MKTEPGFSKSVALIAILVLALAGAVLWLNRRAPEKIPAPASAPVMAEPAAEKNKPLPPAPAKPAMTAPTTVVEKNQFSDLIPIPLAPVLIDAENGSWLKDKDYLLVPHQPQTFGGVKFLMDGLIQLQGQLSKDWKKRNYRETVVLPVALTNFSSAGAAVIQRGSNIASIHLLGATRYGSSEEKNFVKLVWRYTDGTAAATPIDYLTHFRDWVRNAYEQPGHLPYSFSKVVWTKPQPSSPINHLRLYRVSLPNPEPGKVIRQLEFVSAMKDPTLFIVGVTLDTMMVGLRPDGSPDLEPMDAAAPKQIQISVVSPENQPVAKAKLEITFQQSNGTKVNRSSSTLKTDGNGMATVNYPPEDLLQLDVSAEHEDFSGQKMLWDMKAGDTIPASYTLKLSADVKIGGLVVDESENPISGATISLYRFWSGDDGRPDKKGEQPSFSNKSATSDASGQWQAKGLPPTLLDHIGFEVKHPDFLRASANVGDNATAEKQLRAGTYKTVLKRGLVTQGRVLDDSDKPVAGADVFVGRRYFPDRQQTKSAADGRFSFRNVNEGETIFSTMAKGFGPDSKTVNVHADMGEVVFRLKAGTSIRAHVQDESAQPVANARVGLENGGGDGNAGDLYDFTANTDSAGNFSWDSAPDETLTFYVFHDGFESKRNAKLAPNADNIVTLRRSRTLNGVVLDATTEQPVTKFTVRTGTASGDDSNVYGVIQYKDFSAADGRFTMQLNEEADNAVLVMADGYTDKVEKFPEAQNGAMSVVVKLKPSESMSGIVLAPDGTPAPGVQVAAAAGNNASYFQLTGGRLRSFDSRNKTSTTDAEGRFKISSPPDAAIVVAAGEPGFASAPLAEVRSSGTIVLQAWGRIEGTLKIGGQPGVGKELLFNLDIPGIGTDFNGYKSTTDAQGQFTMEKIPPGDGTIVRLIKTSENSWTHSDGTPVTVKAGETTPVSLGDNGAIVVGKIRFDNPPTNSESLSFAGDLSGQMPQQPPAFNSSAEAQAYYQSPEWRALARLQKHYAIEMKPDGSFEADNVVPGNYSLNISVRRGGQRSWEHPPLANGSAQVTVPDSFSPSTPINVGEVVLQPRGQ